MAALKAMDGGNRLSVNETDANAPDAQTWNQAIAQHGWSAGLLSPTLVTRWGNRPWRAGDDDMLAAAALHTQITSRISTQPLGYSDGVEVAALDSLYCLFDITRAICERYPMARHFEAIAWDVLNGHLRPFTARWHPRARAGKLAALDASDEFRAELARLQPRLAEFDDVLLLLRDGTPPAGTPPTPARSAIEHEMRADLRWGITNRGGLPDAVARQMDAAEREAIGRRRAHYGLASDKPHAVGLALSGGGVRSATFALGVLVALARRNVLPQVDYLSTVSGGGYVGSFLTAYLNGGNADRPAAEASLRSEDLPFRREEGEAEALRWIRHRSRYLSTGSLRELVRIAAAQLQGLVVTLTLLIVAAAVSAVLDLGLRAVFSDLAHGTLPAVLGAVFWAFALALVSLGRRTGIPRAAADTILGVCLTVLLISVGWEGLGLLHQAYRSWGLSVALGAAAATVCASLGIAIAGRRLLRLKLALVGVAAVAAPLLLVLLELAIFGFVENGTPFDWIVTYEARFLIVVGLVVVSVGALALVDVNAISPHRHYRDKLAAAFLVRQPSGGNIEPNGSLKLSAARNGSAAPYHLVNCALNVPDSRDPRMQGRPVDFFLFSPAMTGSPLTGYAPTQEWEALGPRLDLATATAISGAAAAPQMGLATSPSLRFWLALLNIRLGQWIQVPERVVREVPSPQRPTTGKRPDLRYLLREMTGLIDESRPFVNLTDGGHIENLGVYELLRRRCKFIVAVDGEHDAEMTFAALTTLQRLAAIDLGVGIDIDLDDLRLDQTGLSRSHFRFCRIRYPERSKDVPAGIGYLLYVKLSLTGNEGEFIRRYRLDEPAFPHHSTADQFFTEAQFEAYRSLGEHVGEKLFLRAIVGSLAASTDVEIEKWFEAIGTSMLEPLQTFDPAAQPDSPASPPPASAELAEGS
ncbi:patatin-like phospholipase family protein [Methylobacterium radiotolerans]|uniref:patatin-like phospholipase family protein n=1 Tax=Methylobacterium radiotolerans TaxID=31998 RepID=UPI000D5E8F6A|nr:MULTISPECIES: patatin-like phospholipase family protein [Methylobacterium]MDE3745107.1 patatin-like phospholipase family protein [Methylobacterium radiotolerans]PVY95452.1 patatin-like phospholipase [Methylobacterium organophilum]